jgi:DNA-binding response OmpR family regulator
MGNKSGKIVLVEDDPTLTDMYTSKFKSDGLAYLTARDGQAGLELIVKEMPQVILLDIMMPKLDGFSVLAELKNNPKTKNIPVIILSNLGQKSDIEKGLKLGAVDYIVKATMTPTEVEEKLKKYL